MGSLQERHISLWIGTTSQTNYPALPGDRVVDVAVLGGGITGLSTALELIERGLTVAVVEAGRIAAGTTGYTTAKVTALHGLPYGSIASRFGEAAARRYAEANTWGLERIAGRVAQEDIPCGFRRSAAYTYATEASRIDALKREAALLSSFGYPATFVTETPLPFGVAGAVRLDDQAYFHPRAYCLALAGAIGRAGGTIYEHTRATDIRDGATCTVETEHGRIDCSAVVVATQIPFLNRGLFYAKAHPHRSYAIGTRIDGDAPEGMFLSIDEPVRSVRPHHDRDGTYLIVGGGGHRTGEEPDGDPYADLEAWAREHFRVSAVPYRWSAQDYMPADPVPYIGRSSRTTRNVFVATGFRKWGMTSGTLAGLLIADLITDTPNPWARLFDATRLNTLAAVPRLVLENASVAKHYAEDLGRSSRSVQDLAPGEGALVSDGARTVAAFRDEDGTVCALSARCTHLGCRVKFNDLERTWDCPCHGSRFTVRGEVIQGPATKDLERIELGSEISQ